MNVRGRIRAGQIELEAPLAHPEGVEVSVEVTPLTSPTGATPPDITADPLANLIGAVDDLPADFASAHDHYIHGLPRR